MRHASTTALTLLTGLLALCGPGIAGTRPDGPDVDDYQRSLGLRNQWQWLTENVAWTPTWLPDGRFHYRKTVPNGMAFVIVDTATLEKQPAFDHGHVAAGLSKATGRPIQANRLPFEHFSFVDEGKAIEVWLDEKGWICRLDQPACSPRQRPTRRPRGFGVVRDLSVAADNPPRHSPDGRFTAQVIADNVVVHTLDGGTEVLRTRDGSPGDFYDPETLAWSPDSRHLAVYRVRPGHQREVLRVETSPRDALQPRVQRQLYPKPGDAVDIERPVLIDVSARRVVTIDDTLFGHPYQLSPIQWSNDSQQFSFKYIQRGHQRVRLIGVRAETAQAHVMADEHSPTFVDTWRGFHHDVGGLGRDILWLSERDGRAHLYRLDGRTGTVRRQITRGDWLVREVLHVDDEQRRVWFTASGGDPGTDPYYRHGFSIDFDGRDLTRLTHGDGDHELRVSPDGRHYIDLWSRVDHAPVMTLYRTGDRESVAEIERGNIDALLAAGWRAPEPFVAKGRDGRTDIWGLVVKPRDHDPAQRYPVIENIYAGPHDAFVPKTFWPFGFHSGGDKVTGMQALADLGFIVVQIDGMGTAHRGKAFHDVAWKNLADSGFPDRIAWHRAHAAVDPSYDIGRVGIYGASAGGQSAANALLFHPGFYKVAVAYNGCYDNRMDKISWNEQWLGWPVDDSYIAASTAVHAHRLQGELLLIVGEQDSNVDPASTMQVVDALVRAGKDFDLLNLPGEGHAAGRSTGPIDYAHRRQFDFFVRHLLGQSTPRWNADKP